LPAELVLPHHTCRKNYRASRSHPCPHPPQAEELIKEHGGVVQKSVSGRVDYLVVGLEPGDSKMKKAEECKVKQIDEDGLFELIRKLPSKPFSMCKRNEGKDP
jgi:hypothetical protein